MRIQIRKMGHSTGRTLRWAESWFAILDPRLVRLKRPRRLPRWVVRLIVVTALMLIGVASLAAVGRSQMEIEDVEPVKITAATQPIPAKTPFHQKEIASQKGASKQHECFFDPLYVFLEHPVQKVSAYPLSTPTGLVVDIYGAFESTEEAIRQVGQDSRINSVRRRVTRWGIRYIIGLSTPVRKIDFSNEGKVVMIFPLR